MDEEEDVRRDEKEGKGKRRKNHRGLCRCLKCRRPRVVVEVVVGCG